MMKQLQVKAATKAADVQVGDRWCLKHNYDAVRSAGCMFATVDKIRSRGVAITWDDGGTTYGAPYSWFIAKVKPGTPKFKKPFTSVDEARKYFL